jgi:predicted 3-demethylubiquinone-9 3-methyltransferase (glyoxalase superfamily)
MNLNKITPCLWFDTNAEEAVAFYLSVFPDSRILEICRYPKSDHPAHVGREGSVLTITCELLGQTYTALNGGPHFKFSAAVSFQILCDTQDEIDNYWSKLTAGGPIEAQQCGWLQDRFGLSWQIVPRELDSWLAKAEPDVAARVMSTLLTMTKLDIATLKTAACN